MFLAVGLVATTNQALSRHVKFYTEINSVPCEERKPTRCNNIDDLLSIVDVDY